MYTYEKVDNTYYAIFDPEGFEIATVNTEEDAEALLSHLNRG